MTAATYGVPDFVRDLRAAADSAHPEAIMESVKPLARRLALSREWLVPRHYTADEAQGFGLHVLHEEADHSLLVFVAAWAPGRGVTPHNHGTWAVVAGVDGFERNTFWQREDDGSRPGYAKLSKVREQVFGPGDVFAMPAGTIHSVVNDTAQVTVSLHVYGFNLNLTRRSQFDPERETEEPVTLKMN
jgi:predicted metal-dependent enzyme (double-stranded beta helix superfamily)